MFTTLFFLELIAFQIWYITTTSGYVIPVVRNKKIYRTAGIALLVLATVLFIARLGFMSGITASLVGLMGVGGLVVLLNPFHYVSVRSVVLLYVLFAVLEVLI